MSFGAVSASCGDKSALAASSTPTEPKSPHKLLTSLSWLWAAPLKSTHSKPESLQKLSTCLIALHRAVAGAWASDPAPALSTSHLAVQGPLYWWP